MPFPTAQQVNLPACSPHSPLMLSVNQKSRQYQFQSHWFDPTRNQNPVCSSRDSRSIHSAIMSFYSPVEIALQLSVYHFTVEYTVKCYSQRHNSGLVRFPMGQNLMTKSNKKKNTLKETFYIAGHRVSEQQANLPACSPNYL